MLGAGCQKVVKTLFYTIRSKSTLFLDNVCSTQQTEEEMCHIRAVLTR